MKKFLPSLGPSPLLFLTGLIAMTAVGLAKDHFVGYHLHLKSIPVEVPCDLDRANRLPEIVLRCERHNTDEAEADKALFEDLARRGKILYLKEGLLHDNRLDKGDLGAINGLDDHDIHTFGSFLFFDRIKWMREGPSPKNVEDMKSYIVNILKEQHGNEFSKLFRGLLFELKSESDNPGLNTLLTAFLGGKSDEVNVNDQNSKDLFHFLFIINNYSILKYMEHLFVKNKMEQSLEFGNLEHWGRIFIPYYRSGSGKKVPAGYDKTHFQLMLRTFPETLKKLKDTIAHRLRNIIFIKNSMKSYCLAASKGVPVVLQVGRIHCQDLPALFRQIHYRLKVSRQDAGAMTDFLRMLQESSPLPAGDQCFSP